MAKTTVLGIRLTEQERAELDRHAKECGMTTAAWAKSSLLTSSNQVVDIRDGMTNDLRIPKGSKPVAVGPAALQRSEKKAAYLRSLEPEGKGRK